MIDKEYQQKMDRIAYNNFIEAVNKHGVLTSHLGVQKLIKRGAKIPSHFNERNIPEYRILNRQERRSLK